MISSSLSDISVLTSTRYWLRCAVGVRRPAERIQMSTLRLLPQRTRRYLEQPRLCSGDIERTFLSLIQVMLPCSYCRHSHNVKDELLLDFDQRRRESRTMSAHARQKNWLPLPSGSQTPAFQRQLALRPPLYRRQYQQIPLMRFWHFQSKQAVIDGQECVAIRPPKSACEIRKPY